MKIRKNGSKEIANTRKKEEDQNEETKKINEKKVGKEYIYEITLFADLSIYA